MLVKSWLNLGQIMDDLVPLSLQEEGVGGGVPIGRLEVGIFSREDLELGN